MTKRESAADKVWLKLEAAEQIRRHKERKTYRNTQRTDYNVLNGKMDTSTRPE